MNFAPYQNRESLNAPASQVSNVRYTNAGEQALARADGVMGAAVADGFLKLKDTVEQGKALEANNEYNQRMSQGTTELMQLKEQEALDITDQYDQLRKKTMDDIQKKYGTYLTYGAGAAAFREYTMRDDATRRANVMKYQHAQTEAYRTTQTNNALAVCAQQAADSGYTDEGIDGAIERALPIVGFQFANYGDEKIKEQQRVVAGQFVGAAMRFAVSSNDFIRTQELVKRYGKYMTPDQRSAAMAIAIKRQKEAETLSMNQKMLGDLGWNASYDDVKTWVEKHFPTARHGGVIDKASFFEAVAGQESGGNYEAENGRTGAFGKYQIMPENWSSWAVQAGLPADAPKTPENQETIAKYKLGEYFDNYGAEGALVSWYAGEANGERWANGAPDAIGEGGHYSWDAPQGDGDEPSIREYVQQALSRLPEGGGGVSGLELEEKTKEAYAYYQEQVKFRENESRQRIQDGVNQLQIMMNEGQLDPAAYDSAMNAYLYRPDGTLDEGAAARLGKYGAHFREIAKQEAARKANGGGKKMDDPLAAVKIQQMLEEGMDQEDVIHFIVESNFKNAQSLVKMVLQDYPQGKGVFSQDWDELKGSIKSEFGMKYGADFDLQWALAKDYAYSRAQDYIEEHKGNKPTIAQKRQWLAESFLDVEYPISDGWFGGKETLTKAQLYGLGVESFGYNARTKSQTVTLPDGEGTFDITSEQYERIKNGENAHDVIFSWQGG